MRVLDAFGPRDATWSGLVISSPRGPSGGPSKTHLLPGGRVPRVHRARSPVPPRLPLCATPRSVRQFAAVAAGAYPPRRPPNAWSPGVPALRGPCYWLVASGNPVGWSGGCLALGLVRGAMRHYCLGRCSAMVVCVRRLRPVRGGLGRCRVLCLPCFPLPAPHLLRCVWRAVLSGCPLSSLAGTHSMRSVRSAGSVRLPFWFSPRVLCVCVPSRSRGVRAPPPSLGWCGARTSRGTLLGAGRAVSLGSVPLSVSGLGPVLRLACFGGGRPGPVSPYLAWGCALPVGWVRAWGPITNPTARALASWPCALAWRAVGAAQGRPGWAPLAWVRGAPGRAHSHPRPVFLLGMQPDRLPTGCESGGCRRGDLSPTPQRALSRAGFARCQGGLKVPGGGASCLGVRRPGSGALPAPTTRPFGRAAGAHYPVAVGAGSAGVETRRQPHRVRSCELALRAVAAA